MGWVLLLEGEAGFLGFGLLEGLLDVLLQSHEVDCRLLAHYYLKL